MPKALSLTEELLTVDSCWGRESHFSLWEGPGDDSMSTYIWAALIRLSELSRKCTSSWEMFMLEEIQGAGGSWAENFQRISKIIFKKDSGKNSILHITMDAGDYKTFSLLLSH